METKRTLLTCLLLAAVAVAQDLPSSPALDRAVAVEEFEHDVAAARVAYRAVAEDAAVSDAVRRHAWLRLARVMRSAGEDAAAALAAAAKGEDAVAVAARALSAEAAQDPQREAELQRRLEELVRNAPPKGLIVPRIEDVLWFRDAAFPVLARHATEFPGYWSTDALWLLDSARAKGFLREKLESQDVEVRQAFAGRIPRQTVHGDLVRMALRDADAAVVQSALVGWKWATVADVVSLLTDARDDVRRRAITFAAGAFSDTHIRRVSDFATNAALLAPTYASLVRATDPTEHRNGLRVVGGSAMATPETRRALVTLLPELTRMRANVSLESSPGDAAVGPDENADELRSQMVAAGRALVDGDPHPLREAIRWHMREGWKRPALAAVLTAVRLDYLRDGEQLAGWIAEHAIAADVEAVVDALAGTPDHLLSIAPWLSEQENVPATAFASLVAAASRTSRDRDSRVRMLLRAIARTAHPDAATTIVAAVGNRFVDFEFVAELLTRHLAVTQPNETTCAAMRQMLRMEQPEHSQQEPRARLLLTLLRLGDPEVVDLLFAHQRRLDGVTIPLESLGVGAGWNRSVDGKVVPTWLTMRRRHDGAMQWWHGYDTETTARMWERLLETRGTWSLAAGIPWNPDDGPNGDASLVRVVVTAARRTLDIEAFDDAAAFGGATVARGLFHALQEGTLPASTRPLVAALREDAFTARSAHMRIAALESLSTPFDAAARERVLAALADPSSDVALRAQNLLVPGDVPITRDVVAQVFRAKPDGDRMQGFRFAERATEDVTDLIRERLQDSYAEARREACVQLGRRLNVDAVPALLEILKDPDARVREAAVQALQAIRFYHDEKSHWDRVLAGRAGLTAASAGAALLEQAADGNDRETRVLAIRSLGVLRAAETQPFLIRWTKDADDDVAAAARAALVQLHAGK